MKIILNQPKALYLLLTALLLAGLLAACGDETAPTPAAQLAVATTAAATTTEAVKAVEPVPTSTPLPPTATSAPTATATPKATVAVTATVAPTATTAPTTAPTVAPTVATTTAPLKSSVLLEPMNWEAQTWNNCAPMSALMALSYYGIKLTQAECGLALRPNGGDRPSPVGDKHVEPQELVSFIQKQGLRTMVRENGTFDKLRALLAAGVPVITQQWLHDPDDIGHYRVARGYDLKNDTIIFNDSMDSKPRTVVSVKLQDKLWKGWNRRYMPVYSAKQEATVMAILGDDANEDANLSRATSVAQKYSESNPKDIDAWRNLGYLRYAAGDCKGALTIWEQRITKMLEPTDNGPYNRFLWYQLWPIECYNQVGNYQQVIKMSPNEIQRTGIYAQARYQYAVALMNVGRKDEAVSQLKKAILDDQNFKPSYKLLEKLGVK